MTQSPMVLEPKEASLARLGFTRTLPSYEDTWLLLMLASSIQPCQSLPFLAAGIWMFAALSCSHSQLASKQLCAGKAEPTLVGSTSCSSSGMGAALSAVWFISA